MQDDYWSKARQGRITALNAMSRLAEGYGAGRTPRPPELGQLVSSSQDDQDAQASLRVVMS
ncbi:MAG: hypothetical protein AAF922_13340 [Pseudomonadota bacterium]